MQRAAPALLREPAHWLSTRDFLERLHDLGHRLDHHIHALASRHRRHLLAPRPVRVQLVPRVARPAPQVALLRRRRAGECHSNQPGAAQSATAANGRTTFCDALRVRHA